jgi:hypothetical protein
MALNFLQHIRSATRWLIDSPVPINPEAWRWYRDALGGNRTPVVDTWWQTETGALMISPLPGVSTTIPGSAIVPVPGISARIVDDHGNLVKRGPRVRRARAGLSGAGSATASDAARHLGRSGAVQGTIFGRGLPSGTGTSPVRATTGC